MNRIDPDGRADKGAGHDEEIHTRCGDVACAPSDPVGKTPNLLMIGAFTAPMMSQYAVVAPKEAALMATSQAGNAIAGGVSTPDNPIAGAVVGGLTGTASGATKGGALATPVKNILAASFSTSVTTGRADPKAVETGLATGVAVGWLDVAARAGASSPGGNFLRYFAAGMDALLQVVAAAGTPAPEQKSSPCAGGGSC